jgi:hypothetical protein
MVTPKVIEEISDFFVIKVFAAAGNNPESLKALSTIAKSLREVFRFFEPSFFSGKLYVFKRFDDQPVFDRTKGVLLFDKNPLLEKFEGNLFIQVFSNGQSFYWEDQDAALLATDTDLLTYFFEANQEYFLVSGQQIEFTQYPYGSMFAPQFYFLDKAFQEFRAEKIRHSSCPLFRQAWRRTKKTDGTNEYDDNRVLFQGGGRGSGLPEKYMQASLENFLKSDPNFRGIEMEVNREFNVEGDRPKPVDFRVTWLEANRIALIEVKWTGDSVSAAETLTTHRDRRVNDGLHQLKGYWDSARQDFPQKLIKAFLLVIDGRRNGVTKDSVEVSFEDGFYYRDAEFEIEDNRRYFEEIKGFEPPVRMFAEPKCTIE